MKIRTAIKNAIAICVILQVNQTLLSQQSEDFIGYNVQLIVENKSAGIKIYVTEQFNPGIVLEDTCDFIISTSCYYGDGYIYNLEDKTGYTFFQLQADTLNPGRYGIKWFNGTVDTLAEKLEEEVIYLIGKY